MSLLMWTKIKANLMNNKPLRSFSHPQLTLPINHSLYKKALCILRINAAYQAVFSWAIVQVSHWERVPLLHYALQPVLSITSSTCLFNKNMMQPKTWSAPWITQVINSKKQIPDCCSINKIFLRCLSAQQHVAHQFSLMTFNTALCLFSIHILFLCNLSRSLEIRLNIF